MSAIARKSQRLILAGVPWQRYERILRAFDDRHLRVTYDQGNLEIMTLSHEHESYSYILGRIIDAVTEELGLPVAGGKSTTFKRRRHQRGLEPDNCYWIANESRVRGKAKIDLRVDPPPDLAVEIDITHSTVDRMSIYSGLRVPEVWRFDGRELVFHVLAEDGRYQMAAESRSFPGLRASDVSRFLAQRGRMDTNSLIRQFRAWVRERLCKRSR